MLPRTFSLDSFGYSLRSRYLCNKLYKLLLTLFHFMKTSSFLYPLTGMAALASLASCGSEKQAPKQYNIVYIMTDDHTAQMMSCYGSRFVETPNLDRIANDGVIFTNSFVANSLSGPSRACMLTGKHSHANGFTDNTTCVFDGSQQTMPKLLQQAGYQTAIIGKWHLVSLPTGFDHWEILPEQGDYYNPDFITMDNDTIRKEGYVTNLITDMSIDWMENQRDKNKPFCLFIHHKAIHRNWLPALEDLPLFEDKTFPLPDNFYDDYEGRPAAAAQEMSIWKNMDLIYDNKMDRADKTSPLKERYESYIGRLSPEDRKVYDDFYQPIIDDFYKKNPQGKELAEWKYQRYMRDYAKVVKSLDENVGRVLDYLKEKSMLDNTLVVYTSDQGFYMGEHGWFDKRFMYEESMHTPLIMHLPKDFKAKGEIPQMVQNIDYAPTFLELAGAPIPEDIQGVSLVPLLKGEKPADWRKSLYYHFYEFPAEHMVKRHYGVRTDRYKLIHFYNDIDEWELYDLKEDPTEMHNLYGQPGYEKITEDLKAELVKLQTQYKDPIEQKLKQAKEAAAPAEK
jgi:arylsulfatase A-like enzyme